MMPQAHRELARLLNLRASIVANGDGRLKFADVLGTMLLTEIDARIDDLLATIRGE
jgi:hypothetical protein